MIGMTSAEYRQAQADAMTEAQLLAAILGTPRAPGLADTLGWMGYHTHRSDRSPAGFPDLTLVHPGAGRLIFAELKRQSPRAKPTPEQVAWINGVNAVSDSIASDLAAERLWSEFAVPEPPTRVIAVLWRPLDLLDGIVEAMLRVSD